MISKSFTSGQSSLNLDIDYSKHKRYINIAAGLNPYVINIPPTTACLINDPSPEIISFYRHLTNPDFIEELKTFSIAWKLLEQYALDTVNEHFMSFLDYSDGVISKNDLTYIVRAILLMHLDNPKFDLFVRNEFCVSFDMFINSMVKSISQELIRLKTKVGNQEFSSSVSDEFIRCIETAYRNGLYNHYQNLYNWEKTELIHCLSTAKLTAIWYFISQLSQGNSVMYDKNGNIKSAYGGASANFFDFEPLIQLFTSDTIKNWWKNTTFYNLNPDHFLSSMPISEDDIVVYPLNGNAGNHLKSLTDKQQTILSILDSISSKWVIIAPRESAELVLSYYSAPVKLLPANLEGFSIITN